MYGLTVMCAGPRASVERDYWRGDERNMSALPETPQGGGPASEWRNRTPGRTIPPPMSLLVTLLLVGALAGPGGLAAPPSCSSDQAAPVYGQMPSREVTRDTVPPYLAFPELGLDDPAAYEGYDTRVYQDAARNAFQIYLKGNTGRVVNLWAAAANESVGFTVRGSIGKPAGLAWGSSGALVTGSAHTRSVSYALELPPAVRVGLFLLGSMRVERDFQYAGRDSL